MLRSTALGNILDFESGLNNNLKRIYAKQDSYPNDNINSLAIHPQDYPGYEKINVKYKRFLNWFLSSNHDIIIDESFAERLSLLIFDFLATNKFFFTSEKSFFEINKDNLIHSHIKVYTRINDISMKDETYLAVEYFFKSILPDTLVKEELKKSCNIYCHGVEEPSHINYQMLKKRTPSFRNFIISEIPFIPWVHIEISNPNEWHLKGGIDTYSVICQDDCPPGVFKFKLKNYSETLLKRMIATNLLSASNQEKSQKMKYMFNDQTGKNLVLSTNSYTIISAILNPLNIHSNDFSTSRLLEVVPITQLRTVCNEIFKCYRSLH
jgi:hypothetical protein